MQSLYISDLPSLTLREIKQSGLLQDPRTPGLCRGSISLRTRRGDYETGEYSFQVSIQSDGEGGGSLEFDYLLNGQRVRYSYPLVRRESNLPSGGSYFAIKTRTGRGTKLYLYNGYFIPREDLPGGMEYGSQAETKYWRGLNRDGNLAVLEEIFQKYRKVHYRGTLTRYGNKLSRHYNQISNWIHTIDRTPIWRDKIQVWERYVPENTDFKTYPRYKTRIEKQMEREYQRYLSAGTR